MILEWLQIILLVFGGVFLSIGAGLFKDWLKKVLPRQVAYIGAILFIIGALVTGLFNYSKRDNKKVSSSNTVNSSNLSTTDSSNPIKDSDINPSETPENKKGIEKIWRLINEKKLEITIGKAFLLDNDVRISARFYSSYCYINLFFP